MVAPRARAGTGTRESCWRFWGNQRLAEHAMRPSGRLEGSPRGNRDEAWRSYPAQFVVSEQSGRHRDLVRVKIRSEGSGCRWAWERRRQAIYTGGLSWKRNLPGVGRTELQPHSTAPARPTRVLFYQSDVSVHTMDVSGGDGAPALVSRSAVCLEVPMELC